MNYMGNNPANTAPVSVWGIANPHLVDMFNPNFDIEGGNPFMNAGSGMRFGIGAMPQGVDRGVYEAAMADRYANTRVGTDALGNAIYGYTGQDDRSTGSVNMSMAGTRIDTNPYVYGSKVNAPLGDVGSSNPRKNYFNGRRVTGGR